MLYVCDNCGRLEEREAVPEGGEWACPECGESAAWEFPPDKRLNAQHHAEHIARGIGKGAIFTHARRR